MIGKLYGWKDRPITALVVDDHASAPDAVPEGSVIVAPLVIEGLCPAMTVPLLGAPPGDGSIGFVVSA